MQTLQHLPMPNYNFIDHDKGGEIDYYSTIYCP